MVEWARGMCGCCGGRILLGRGGEERREGGNHQKNNNKEERGKVEQTLKMSKYNHLKASKVEELCSVCIIGIRNVNVDSV